MGTHYPSSYFVVDKLISNGSIAAWNPVVLNCEEVLHLKDKRGGGGMEGSGLSLELDLDPF